MTENVWQKRATALTNDSRNAKEEGHDETPYRLLTQTPDEDKQRHTRRHAARPLTFTTSRAPSRFEARP